MNRIEACNCGGFIAAPSLDTSAPAVRAHNGTLLHRLWRLSQADEWWINPAVLAERLPTGTYIDPRRRWPTADDKPVDMRQGDVGASADGAEGR